MVQALTFPDQDRELPPRRVTGQAVKQRWVESLGYRQCTVDGTQVDPKTVRTIPDRPRTKGDRR